MNATAPLPIETFRFDVLKQRAEIRHSRINPIVAASELQRRWVEREGRTERDASDDDRMLREVRAALGRVGDEDLSATG